jgi:glycosyltransferase involved in cell wall biosynthesis
LEVGRLSKTPSEILEKTATVLPSFNAARHLAEVIEDVHRFLPKQQIIVVDDGSTDGTRGVAESAGVVVVEHPVNMGKGAALHSGARKAIELGMTHVITLDADGQHDAGEIPNFAACAAETDADIVIGNRMDDRADMPGIRIFANRATSWFVTLRTGVRIPDSQNGYRMIKTWVFEKITFVTTRYDAESEILIKTALMGGKIESIPAKTIYGTETSSVHPFVDTIRFFRMVIRSMFW